jgi:hypothetical protein
VTALEAVGTYVVVGGAALQWAIDARFVVEIASEADWKGEPPRDISAMWNTRLEPGIYSRVLSVRTTRGPIPVRASSLSHKVLDFTEVLPLPDAFRTTPAAKLILGIVFGDDRRPVVVLDPEGLA